MPQEKIWPQGFDVKNPEHLKRLRDEAKAYAGRRKPIGDDTELGQAYIAAKKAYYTDKTLGPDYIRDLVGRKETGIPQKKAKGAKESEKDDKAAEKAKEEAFRKVLEETGLTEEYEKYKADFAKALEAHKAGHDDVPFPRLSEEFMRLIQEELGVPENRRSGAMNPATEKAIREDKNNGWIKSIVTETSQNKIRDVAEAMDAARFVAQEELSEGASERGAAKGGAKKGGKKGGGRG